MLKNLAVVLVTFLAAQGTAAAQVVVPVRETSSRPLVTAPVVDRFGGRSQFFFGGQTGASLGGSTTFGNRTRGVFNVAPVVGMFFTDHLFGRLGADFSALTVDPVSREDFIASLVLEPGIGVAIPIGQHSFAPSVSYNFLGVWVLGSSATANGASVDLPFVFRVASHVGITVGPKVAFRTPGITGGDTVTLSYALNVGVLIWP